MTRLPIATAPDPQQVEALRPFVEGLRCVVVGSAPLATKHADIGADEIRIAVNGGISSIAGPVDIWVVNSKAQDQPGALIRPLHKLMLQQGAHRNVRHVLMLRGPKVASEGWTRAYLRGLRCDFSSWSVLDKPTKRWVEGELCGRKDDKKPCSSGILTAACVLWAGAASVRLAGFSLDPGYHYTTERPQSWWRDHVAADMRALIALNKRFGQNLTINRRLAVAV